MEPHAQTRRANREKINDRSRFRFSLVGSVDEHVCGSLLNSAHKRIHTSLYGQTNVSFFLFCRRARGTGGGAGGGGHGGQRAEISGSIVCFCFVLFLLCWFAFSINFLSFVLPLSGRLRPNTADCRRRDGARREPARL